MKHWQLFVGVRLLVVSLSGFLGIVVIQPGLAEEKLSNEEHKSNSTELNAIALQEVSKNIPQLSKIELPATNAQMLVQTPTPTNPPSTQADVVAITGVKANPTDKGVEVILETPLGTQLQVTNRSTGNNFIVDVAGGQLRLADGNAFTFRSEKPVEGITEITVTNIDANTVRVMVVGEKSLPTVELYDDDAGLVFGIASTATATQPPQQPQTPQAEQKPENQTPQQQPSAQEDEPIELVVTGEQDGYNVPDASTATRTDTPLRDIPQSIQVVPRQILEDRNVRRLNEALETVSGVSSSFSLDGSGVTSGGRFIRGFEQLGTFRNGLSQGNEIYALDPIGTIERVEVLKGPASVLFGAIEPGGIVNTVTRQPLSEPYYRLEFQAGNRNFYQPTIDFSGPLTTDKKVLYRLIAGYEALDGFKEFTGSEQFSVAPSITVNFSERTNLNLYYEFSRASLNTGIYITDVVRSDGSFITPRNLFTSYLNTPNASFQTQRIGYTFNHRFSDNWQIRNSLAIQLQRYERPGTQYGGVRDDRFLTFSDGFSVNPFTDLENNYFGQVDLLGKFNTGSISHQVLVGFDVNDFAVVNEGFFFDVSGLPDLDIRNPNYGVPDLPLSNITNFSRTSRSYGLYLQDQIAFSDNLKLLIGGRYDWVSDELQRTGFENSSLNDSAFSPRLGLVYQPSKTVALYTSYSRSFRPSAFGFAADGSRNFQPTRGTQYEVGVKADFLDGRLSTTLAAYHLTKTNVITPDPNPVLAAQGFSVQTGEQRSQGIELDIAGEILPGWKVTGSYTYTDAEVTKDNPPSVGNRLSNVGNRLSNVPENQVSLWTTYEIQQSDLKGLGFGLGLFYVGARQADLANETILRDYFRTDASLFYKRDGFRAAINVRNLFDIDYAEYANGRLSVYRGNPFTITGTISWEF
ncbi:MAG: TonB-dependent siderophore receptor [Nostoc sp. DedQUE12b]|uniref:TonB-dependent siderophore receptor n=1 Tax=Nostoc sp. DedQUE12b TaxID=3075398 RepID=UPI002AD3C3D9|nr:TonB-dependent siderophore receptor [Nostoc sp. DedQUE12b]MDZ8084277.1 TonB-dependent siderophore receptor [Nostoc sp. DedQUE12b]